MTTRYIDSRGAEVLSTRLDVPRSKRENRRPYAHATGIAFLLSLFAMWNGYPVLYQDTEAYLRRPGQALVQHGIPGIATSWTEDAKAAPDSYLSSQNVPSSGAETSDENAVDTWVGGRSVYWGLLAYAAVFLFGSWGVVALNGFCCSIAITILWFRSLGQVSARRLYALITPLVVLTPLGMSTALMTPDIMAAVMIISFGVLGTTWGRLSRLDRAVLLALGSFAAVSHDSLIFLSAGLGVIAAVLIARRLRNGMSIPVWNLGALAIPLATGVAGTVIFTLAAVEVTGRAPLRYPFLTANLAELDFGKRHLQDACHEKGYAVCAFTDRLPVSWTDFIFDKSPDTGIYATAPYSVRRELSDEQYRFALGAIVQEPIPAIVALSGKALRQVVTFDLEELQQTTKHDFFYRSMPADVVAAAEETKLWRNPMYLRWVTLASYISVALGALLLLNIARLTRMGSIQLPSGSMELLAILVAGVVLNAAICGILASPLGRFQARVVWIVPMIACLLIAVAKQRSSNCRGSERGTI